MLEDAIPDQQCICGSKCQAPDTVVVYFYTTSSKRFFPTDAIPANTNVKVSSKQYYNCFGDQVDSRLQFGVEVVFCVV